MSKDARTERYEDLWLPPVPSASALAADAKDGQMCFVQDDQTIYAFTGGKWVAAVPRPKAPDA